MGCGLNPSYWTSSGILLPPSCFNLSCLLGSVGEKDAIIDLTRNAGVLVSSPRGPKVNENTGLDQNQLLPALDSFEGMCHALSPCLLHVLRNVVLREKRLKSFMQLQMKCCGCFHTRACLCGCVFTSSVQVRTKDRTVSQLPLFY